MGKSLQHGLGLLKYDDDSPHIIRRLPLTSNDAVGTGGATVVGTGASTFDSNGYKPYYTDGVSNAPANGYLSWDASTNPLIPANLVPRILGGYSISFEVETAKLFATPENIIFFTVNPVTASKEIRALYNKLGQVQVNNSSRALADTTGIDVHLLSERYSDDDFVTPEYTQITYSISTGGKFDVFFGSKWMLSGEFGAGLFNDTNPLDLVTFGGFTGGESFSGYMKNLFIVDRTVSLPWDLNMGRLAFCGDSIIQQGNTPASSDNYPFSPGHYGSDVGIASVDDYSIPNEVHRRFSEIDRYVQPYSFAVSGSRISLSGTPIKNQLDGSTGAQARDLRPDAVSIAGGANDLINAVDMSASGAGTYGEGLRACLDEALSWGFVKGIVVPNIMTLANNPTYDTPTIAAGTLIGNASITSILAEYRALYPNVKFVEADRYTAFGGDTPIVELFGANDIHPSSKGHYVQSKVLFDGMNSLGL